MSTDFQNTFLFKVCHKNTGERRFFKATSQLLSNSWFDTIKLVLILKEEREESMLQQKLYPLHESLRVGIFLAIVGGMLDAHTYLFRGGVFANAQTGNMVLFGISAAEKNWSRCLYYLVPITAFFLGVIVTEILKRKITEEAFLNWRHTILVIEAALLCVLGFLPKEVPDVIVNVTVSFVCSLQVNCFRTLKGNAYATTMCTGNLRSAAEHLCRFWLDHDRPAGKSAARYFIIILFFCFGAATGALFTNLFQEKTLFLCAILLVGTLILLLRSDKHIAPQKES